MHFERAAAILRGVEQAPSMGVAAPLADAELVHSDIHQSMPQGRVRVARSWLFALGYLDRDEDRADYDAALTAAVAAFQREAGLTQDGWIGTAQTWPRLLELVTFEEPLNVDHWRQLDGLPRAALTRAVRLRLSVYGVDNADGVARLDDLLVTLGAGELAGDSLLERYASVLNHDALLARIVAGADEPNVRRMMADPGDQTEAAGAFGLLLNVAKAELWLAQHAEVDLTKAYRGRLRFGRDLVLPREIKSDMVQYMSWVDEEVSGVAGLARTFRRAVRADAPYEAVRLFLKTASEHGRVAEPLADDRLELVETFYGGKGDAVPRRAEVTVNALTGRTGFRSRLWDGLRRLWSWMKTALRRAIATGKRVLKLARDLAAYVFRAATEGLKLVATALVGFVRHAGPALDREQMDPRGWVGLKREFGRDVNVFVHPLAGPRYVAAWMEMRALSAAIFRRSASVIGDAIALGLILGGAFVSGPLVLRSLIGVMRNLRRNLSALGEIAALEARHEELEQGLALAGAGAGVLDVLGRALALEPE
ncbi:MAG: peptidoglycan-binding protein, partial [Pseudomonadota bacterium]